MIQRKIRKLPPRTVVLFEDETDIRLFPPLRSAWSKRGEQAEVIISGSNAKAVLFGSINMRSGHRVFLVHEKATAEDFQTYLRYVRRRYRGWHIAMILDGDSCHTAESSKDFAKELGIELIPLPVRASKLNPMEKLWGDAKDARCANRQYKDLDDEVYQVVEYLETLSDNVALIKSGILSDDFWIQW